MTLLGNEVSTVRQFIAIDKSSGNIVSDINVVQPILQQSAQTRIIQLKQTQERLEASLCWARFRRRCIRCKQGQLGWRRIVEKSFGPIQIGHFQR